MFYDFIITNRESKVPMYRQIYLSVRKSIENGSLKKGTKLPSIRKLSSNLELSKTTVTSAYEQLCAEGFIKNVPQSGFYVEAEFNIKHHHEENLRSTAKETKLYFEYDFSGKSIDEKIINIAEWRKDIRDVINQNYLLTSYGDVQGEKALRNALQNYALGTRSVNTKSENIVVGAGTQPLLVTLCSLMGYNKTVAMADSSFVQSEFIFKSFNYNISYFKSDDFGAKISSLDKIKPDIILINPNFISNSGTTMPINRRLEIIDWANNNNAIIVEDDYNGELRYSTHPMPCVQNYDIQNTVYLGSFSKVLLPSVRISYMVLPDNLKESYYRVKNVINQTASKTEQLALAQYINSGKIYVHLRKARRIYLEKSKIILQSLSKYFHDCKIVFNETSLSVKIWLDKAELSKNIIDKISENSICVMPNSNTGSFLGLSFSGIKKEKIDDGIKLLSKIIFEQ